MGALSGTNLASGVVPFTDADTYPTHDAQYGKGGWREVADSTARDAIPAQRRTAGMIVVTQDDAAAWQLGSDLTTWTAFTSGGGGGITLAQARKAAFLE